MFQLLIAGPVEADK